MKRKYFVPSDHSWICAEHFIRRQKSNDPLSPDYVPTVYCESDREKGEVAFRAYERSVRRRRASAAATCASSLPGKEIAMDVEEQSRCADEIAQDGIVDEACSSQISVVAASEAAAEPDAACAQLAAVPVEDALMHHAFSAAFSCTWPNVALLVPESDETDLQQRLDECEQQLKKSRAENSILKCQVTELEANIRKLAAENTRLRNSFAESLATDDTKVKFYTGLPTYAVLLAIFEFIGAHVPAHARATTSHLTQFVIMLMKLRLGLSDADIAYRFHLTQSAVNKIFCRWIRVSYARLKPLIIWPERGELYKTMPTEFRKHFSKCVCIIREVLHTEVSDGFMTSPARARGDTECSEPNRRKDRK